MKTADKKEPAPLSVVQPDPKDADKKQTSGDKIFDDAIDKLLFIKHPAHPKK